MSTIRHLDPDPRDAGLLASTKQGRTITVCIPCHDEATTIGHLARTIRRELVDTTGLVDELVVVDDGSTDASAAIAMREGATVVAVEPTGAPGGSGKGNALWTGLAATTGDLVVFCDADVTSFRPEWITRLVAPLLADPTLALVKPVYRRPTGDGGGGRTTELVARPLLALCAPPLHELAQPLAGETAARRDVLVRRSLPRGWGVEVALILDIAAELGPHAIGQVDLGVRTHRHRTLADLTVQAAEVTATILGRVGVPRRGHVVKLPDGREVLLDLRERPPLASCAHRQPM